MRWPRELILVSCSFVATKTDIDLIRELGNMSGVLGDLEYE